jgi:AbrB family looped-hinge helix DNA binding protein
MKVITSRITSKGQATIPAEIRRILKVAPGDRVAFKVEEGDKVRISRASPIDLAYAGAVGATLATEWLTAEDDEAYGSL